MDYETEQSIKRIWRKVNSLDTNFCCFRSNICSTALSCIGVSDTGNPNLFLNQSGNWISTSGSGSQNLQSVTDNGNSTTNDINFVGGSYSHFDEDNGSAIQFESTVSTRSTFLYSNSGQASNNNSLLLPINHNGTLVLTINGLPADVNGNIQLSNTSVDSSLTGDGVQTMFMIPHGQSYTPSFIAYTFRNDVAASGTAAWLDWDATTIYINFVTPPNVGTIILNFFIRL